MGVLCAILLLGGCSTTGDDVASDRIDVVVDDFINRMDVFLTSGATAQDLAAMLISLEERHRPTDDDGTLTVDPLSWSGESNNRGGAVIVARISASVPGYDSGTMFGKSYEAGSKVRCLRFHIRTNGPFAVDGIDCPDGPVPAPPTREPAAEIPGDARDRMRSILASSTATTVDADIQAAFDDEALFADTAVDGKRLIATVGTIGGEHCLVAVKEVSGTVTFPSIPREWLMPGEIGCRPAVVTNPPL